MKEVNLYVNRLMRFPKCTLGVMYADIVPNGIKPLCATLEDPDRDNNMDGDLADPGETKVAGDTCIPAGRYFVEFYDSPHFKRKLPHILNVPGFEYVLIHTGNEPAHTKGCILIGYQLNIAEGKIYQSADAEKYLMNLLDGAEKITININYNQLLKL